VITRRLAANSLVYKGKHPRVLVLSRGGFCPKDRRQAELLVQFHREMEVAYCRLVTISTDSLSETNEYRTGVGAHWTFLSDAGRTVQKDLDIAEYTDPVHNPMIPHTIIPETGSGCPIPLHRLGRFSRPDPSQRSGVGCRWPPSKPALAEEGGVPLLWPNDLL